MAKRKSPRPLTAVKLVKTMARADIGTVPAVVVEVRRKPEKHKRDLRREPDAE
ncbi:MAG: hypothetical protein ACRD1C_00835 [Terriglobales bacterium]